MLSADGKDLRDDKRNLPQYSYSNMLKNHSTVSDWIKNRYKKIYCGLEVDVLDAFGNKVAGQTKLSNLRDTYLEG